MEGKPPVLATASALNKEMLTTQNIPNKFKFSIGRKLIEIFQRMKKTVSTVLTALVKSDAKSRNSILGFTENAIFFSRQYSRIFIQKEQSNCTVIFREL